MQTDELWLESLAQNLRFIENADGAGEVLDRLLSVSSVAAPRTALFLVRQGRLRGYRASGEGPDASRRISMVDLPANEGWAARGHGSQSPVFLKGADLETLGFGESAAAERCVVWVTLEGKPMAALLAGRKEGERPWSPQGLSILAAFAQSRLDVELHKRRRMAAAPAPAGSPEPSPLASAGPIPALKTAAHDEAPFAAPVASVKSVGSADETALVPFEPVRASTDVRALRLEEARRFARLVATDIRLYNEEAVLVGRRQRDLAQRLEDQMQRGHESFQRRFSDLGADGSQLINDAYIEVLAAGDASLLGLPKVSASPMTEAG